ncbi:hypothetical protein OQA88_6001 [Cercophora sp. LCS_1]
MPREIIDSFASNAPGKTVTVHALCGGHFTLPEDQFVSPSEPGARKTVPSLCFLIQHCNPETQKITRIVFDLGVRRDVGRYSEPIRRHVETRRPLSTDPDVVKSLEAGRLTPDDIDYVIYSHVHWDHIGDPHDFPRSIFIVGHGSLAVLAGTSETLRGGHSFFEKDLLDPSRTIELPPVDAGRDAHTESRDSVKSISAYPTGNWIALGDPEMRGLDFFGDASLSIVDAPGHLPGHINILARVADGPTGSKFVYLAGDACHDRRIINGEKTIGEWQDAAGNTCCIHSNRQKAEETIERIRKAEKNGVEVIFAHDVEWEDQNPHRFFGYRLAYVETV